MFGTKSKLEKKIEDQKDELKRIKKESVEAKEELATFKHKKKLEEEDIKHMRKMEKEALAQTALKKEIELERAKDTEVAAVKDAYRDKMEVRLQSEVDNTKEMYTEILARLPNISVKLKGDA